MRDVLYLLARARSFHTVDCAPYTVLARRCTLSAESSSGLPGGNGGRVEAEQVRLADGIWRALPEQDAEGHLTLLPTPR